MILTKYKENEIEGLTSGNNEVTMQVVHTENYWVDWAIAFQQLCKDKLGLEIERGPGTSIGLIHATYGPYRYQLDADWNQVDGRPDVYPFDERGFTLWEGSNTWDTFTNETGIDMENKRFDFIVWFTTESDDVRMEESFGDRIGVRIKFPITAERGNFCKYYINTTPVIMPWRKNSLNNNQFYDEITETKNSSDRNGIRTVLLPSRIRLRFFNSEGPIWNSNGGVSNIASGKVTSNSNNYNWKKYADSAVTTGTEEEKRYAYSDLGESYTNASFYSWYRGYNIFQFIVSKDKNTIDLRVRNSSGRILFDILYGNLIEEQYEYNGEIKNTVGSFVSVVATDATSNVTPKIGGEFFSDYIVINQDEILSPEKLVNRPVSVLTDNQRSYWGISRLLLHKQHLHCKDLYQVFSFGDLMDDGVYKQKIFVDNNGDEHSFVLFNHGFTDTTGNAQKTTALAIPV